MNRRIFLTLISVLAVVISACQASAKPVWEHDDFAARLAQTNIPYNEFDGSDDQLRVVMSYGVDSNAPDEPRYTLDVIQLLDLMCDYQYEFDVKVEYSDKAFTTVDKETLQAYCEKSITLDQLKSNLFWRY